MPLARGSVFAGVFRLVDDGPLSEGGMGAVYRVEQLSTGKRRALKVMHAPLVADPRLRERFVQEARVGGRIESAHVVDVVSAGIDDATGMPWLAMELLEGRTSAVACRSTERWSLRTRWRSASSWVTRSARRTARGSCIATSSPTKRLRTSAGPHSITFVRSEDRKKRTVRVHLDIGETRIVPCSLREVLPE